MHGSLLQDLAVVLLISAAVTVVFHRFRQPVVLGYLLAGVIIGPHTPPFTLVRDEATVHELANLGMILLMFSLGLHFSLKRLARVGGTALVAALCEILLMVWIGYAVGRGFGWGFLDSIFLGALLSISSTTIIIKALGDLRLTREHFAELIFGVLIVEDILGIALLALLPGIARTGAFQFEPALKTLGLLGIFLACVLVVGLIVVPRLLRYINRFESDEMLAVTSLGLCFGVALLAQLMGYSVALGAFLIGAIIAEAREGPKIAHLAEPVRDMFSAVFFVAIGMLIDPVVLWQYAVPIAVLTVVVVIGKVVTCAFGTFIAGHDLRTSLRVGMGMAQIGEFSFIIAALGEEMHVTSAFLYPIAVAVSAVTTLLTPYLIRASDPVARGVEWLVPRPLLAAVQSYSLWPEGGQQHGRGRRLWVPAAIVALNVALITGLLIAGAALAAQVHWPGLPDWLGGNDTLFWLGSMLLALPLVLATVHELRVLGTAIAGMHQADPVAPEKEAAVHAVVTSIVVFFGSAALALWIVLLSVSIVASWPALAGLLIVLIVVGIVLRRSLVELYARGRALLHETLDQTPHPKRPAALPSLLEAAALETILIAGASPAAGKLIRELQLRQKTGASIVVIERDGNRIINPGPDDELRSGDRLLLLGSREQIEAAQKLLLERVAGATA